MVAKLFAIAGFGLITGPALLAIAGFLDNTTFTGLFVLGFILVIVSNSGRKRPVSSAVESDR